MKICPYCHREISETTIRCQYCRKSLSPKKKIQKIELKNINLEPGYPRWSIKEVLLLWFLVFAANIALEYYETIPLIMEALRKRWFLLIKEPVLQFQLSMFIGTFILKLSAVFIIWAILKSHKIPFVSGLNLNRPIKKEWLWLFPAFIILAAISRFVSDIDPLSPNLPVYLFFKESSIIGGFITLFSLFIIAPVSEEIFFRGFIYPGINKKLGLYWSTLITSLLFMAVHIPQCKEHLAVLFMIFIGGIFLTLARAITRSTLMAILLHSLYNSTIAAAGFIKFLILKY